MNSRYGIVIQSLLAVVFFISCGSSRSVNRNTQAVATDSTETRTEALVTSQTSLSELVKTNARIKLRIRRYAQDSLICSGIPGVSEEIEADIDFSKEESNSEESDKDLNVQQSNESFSKSEYRVQERENADVKINNPLEGIVTNLFFLLVLVIAITIIIKKLKF